MNLTWHAFFSLGATFVMVVALVRGVGRIDLVLLGTLGLLPYVGVMMPEQTFAGFSTPAVIAVDSLFIVAAGIEGTRCTRSRGSRSVGIGQ